MEMKERVRLAVERYLKLTGRRIIYTDYLDRFIVAEDDEGLAFIDVFYTIDNMSNKSPVMKRETFEDVIHKFFLQEHEPVDVSVRYDVIRLTICGNDRALIRHHVNAGLED